MSLVLVDCGYTYPDGTVGLKGVHLEARAGEKLLVTGASGSGKSTLIRLAAGLLQRHGDGLVTGSVSIGGRDPVPLPPAERASSVAFVSQIPTDQLITGSIADELAFGLESAGWSRERIDARIDEIWSRLGLGVSLHRDPSTLSGGQTQRVVVAAATAVGAPVLLLDEPLAQLDSEGIAELLLLLSELAEDGVTVVVVEHRLEVCLPWADRVVVLKNGAISRICNPSEVQVSKSAGQTRAAAPGGAVVAQVRDLRFGYGETPVLKGVDLAIRAGESVALLGPNGVGKSTLLAAFSGEIPGAVTTGRVVDVPQDPDLALFCSTVREELAFGPTDWGISPTETDERVARVAASLGISGLMDRAPQALSRGQRLRVAVGAAVTTEPALLLLDEPTAGQDRESIDGIMDALVALPGETSVIFATHDTELARRRAHRIAFLSDGVIARIVEPGDP